MAKEKADKISSAADLMDACLKAAANDCGGAGIFTVDEFTATRRGMPLRSLALQYLFGSNVLLMELLVEVSGPKASCKSSLVYYLMGEALAMNSMSYLIDTEDKVSHVLLRNFLGENAAAFRHIRTTVLELALKRMSNSLQVYDDIAGKVDYRIPLFMAFDSVAGNKGSSTVAAIAANGFEGKAYAEEALLLSKFIPVLVNYKMGRPVWLFFVNHEKKDLDSNRRPGMPAAVHTLGGDTLPFFASYRLRCRHVKYSEAKTNPGKYIKISNFKNSMGIPDRDVYVWMRWDLGRTPGGDTKQTIWFDWDYADAELLAGSMISRDKMSEVISVTAKGGGLFDCSALGLKECAASTLMDTLRADTERYKAVQAVLGIHKYNVFDPALEKNIPKEIPILTQVTGKGKGKGRESEHGQ